MIYKDGLQNALQPDLWLRTGEQGCMVDNSKQQYQ